MITITTKQVAGAKLQRNGGRDHSKNAVIPKNHKSRINFKNLLTAIMLMCFCGSGTAFASSINLYSPSSTQFAVGDNIDIGATISKTSDFMHYHVFVRSHTNLTPTGDLYAAWNQTSSNFWHTWSSSGRPAGTYRVYVVLYRNNHTEDCRVERDFTLITPYLNLYPNSVRNLVASGEQMTGFQVQSNVNWNLSSNASWLTTSVTNGNGTVSFSITASQNTSTSSRSATITATRTNGGLSASMTITQNGAPPTYYITLTPPSSSHGTVSGGGYYTSGSTCCLQANLNYGYKINWLNSSNQFVSDANPYCFTVTADRTFVARISGIESTITFDHRGGVSGGTTSAQAYYGSPMPGAIPPSRTGYDLVGSFAGINGTGTQYYTVGNQFSMAGLVNWDKITNTTLYAHWIPKSYTVTYDYNGATGGNTAPNKTVTYDSQYGALPAPTKQHTVTYNYNGSTQSNGSA